MLSASLPCANAVQDVWGPRVHGCNGDFDLTLLFQESILFIGPICITICIAVWRMWTIRQCKPLIASNTLPTSKLISYVALLLLQIALLVSQLVLRSSFTKATIAAISLGLVGFLVFGALSQFEHSRTRRPSTLLILYFAYTVPANIVRIRTLWSMPHNTTFTSIFIASTVCQFAVLSLERVSKTTVTDVRQSTDDEKADIISRGFLLWLLPLFVRGYGKPLTLDALPAIEPDLNRTELEQDSKLAQPSIAIELIKDRPWLVLSAILPRLCLIAFTFAQPFLIERATEYMHSSMDQDTYKVGGALIAAYLLVYMGLGITQILYRQSTARAITAVRAELVARIYAHSLTLTPSTTSKASVATLMSADVERVTTGLKHTHEIWAGLIEVALAIWLLVTRLSVAVAASAGLSLVCILITVSLAGLLGQRQGDWLKSIETRIAATVNVLSNMKGIKMTGTGTASRKILEGLRNAEIKESMGFRRVLLYVVLLSWTPTVMSPILGLSIHTILNIKSGGGLEPATLYFSLTIFALLGNALAWIMEGVMGLATTLACLGRIQTFLYAGNHIGISLDNSDGKGTDCASGKNMLLDDLNRASPDCTIQLSDVSAKDVRPASPDCAIQLLDVSAKWDVEGATILNDISMTVQESSVVAILGPVGSGKSTLLTLLLGEVENTTGHVVQSASRIGFCSQTPWLINESLRNNIIGSEVFDREWYNSVIAVTALESDMARMPMGDNTLAGDDGAQLSGGQKKRIGLARAIYAKSPLLVLDDPFNGLDSNTEQTMLDALLGPDGLLRKQRRTVVWATSAAPQVRVADEVYMLTLDGKLEAMDTSKDAQDQIATAQRYIETHNASNKEKTLKASSDTIPELSMPKQIGDKAVYAYYIRIIGRLNSVLFLVMVIIFVFGLIFPQIWVNWWAEASLTPEKNNFGYWAGVYFALGGASLLAFAGAGFYFMTTIAAKSALGFHRVLVDTVFGAPMSFFDINNNGETINRFSQDLQLIDMELPLALIGTIIALLSCIGQCAIIIVGSNWAGISVPVLFLLIVILQKIYLRTSRRLRLLEIEAKAPLFSHFLQTLTGLTTIRAFGWSSDQIKKNNAAILASQKPFYLLFAAQNWLNLVLDLITAGLAVTVMAIGVATKSSQNTSLGLSLFNVVSFSMSSKILVSTWTQLEISMGAVARVRSISEDTAREASGSVEPPPRWPQHGEIQYINVSARYSENLPFAIQNISFHAPSGQRVGVCGRTGSGKSTLLGSLLRLLDLHSGKIVVDGIDISTLEPDKVRLQFITLPQEPLLLCGSIRDNMRLFQACEDSEIVSALEDVQLWDILKSKGGLDAILNDDVLSHGQRQLFCFARATLQQGKILILDEPSSQFDKETDDQVERLMSTKFSEHTILHIAHKLESIVGYDNVLVMENGNIVESGAPSDLLRDSTSRFSQMWSQQSRET